ncbi:ASST-domain-containing protein [Xylaria arbuscula]|nr:ASST-domain-containing protein [Xylaria arbuscula]
MRVSVFAVFLQTLLLGTAYCFDDAYDLFKFVSRPDLMSPKWNITYHHRYQIAPGYWFTTPFKFLNHGLDDVKWVPCQMGPMIYDNDGELVWSGACKYNQRIMYDLYPIELGGQPVLKAMVMHSEFPVSDCGAGVFIDQSYEVVHNFFVDKENNHVNIHEFNYIASRNTTLVTTRRPRQWSGHALGLNEDLVWIDSNGFRAYDLTTGNITFQWHAEYHVSLEESTLDPAYFLLDHDQPKVRVPFTNFTQGRPWDPWHINSVDQNSDGNYLVSLRHLDTIMLIAGDDGRVLWRLGGKHSDYILEGDLKFSRQHHARYVSHSRERDVISFHDNGSGEQDRDFQKPTRDYSRGLVVELLRPVGQPQRARILKEYKRPDRGITDKRGSLQRLQNGNVLMSWTEYPAGYFSEHTDDDEVLMEARFLHPNRLGTYRVYKSTNWVGAPKQPPDIKAIGYGIGINSMTAIYVSWNGATEHKTWKFFSADKFIGQTNRTGFETVFVTDHRATTVRAAAYDATGNFLGKSNDVFVEYVNGWVPTPVDVLHPESLSPVGLDHDTPDLTPLSPDSAIPIDDSAPDSPTIPDTSTQDDKKDVPATSTHTTEHLTPATKPTVALTSVTSTDISHPAEMATSNSIETNDGYTYIPSTVATPETNSLYLGLLGIPSVIGYFFILRIIYRQVRGLLSSRISSSRGYAKLFS